MSPDDTVHITFVAGQPHATKVEIGGKLVTNVTSILISQGSPSEAPEVELTCLGPALSFEVDLSDIKVAGCCPRCRRELNPPLPTPAGARMEPVKPLD